MKFLSSSAVVLMLSGNPVLSTAATTYEVTRLNDYGGVGPNALATVHGIARDSGTPFGRAFVPARERYAAVSWDEGKPRKLESLKGNVNEVLGASPSADLFVGIYGDSSGPRFPVAWNFSGTGAATRLKPLVADSSAYAIAATGGGIVFGHSFKPEQQQYSAVYWALPSTKPKEMKQLASSLGSQVKSVGVNGAVIGTAQFVNFSRPVMWADRTSIPVELPDTGTAVAIPTAINATGQISGWVVESDNSIHAIVWSDGVVVRLGGLGGTTTYAKGINDAGTVVGYAVTSGSSFRAVVWEGTAAVDINSRLSESAKTEGWVVSTAQGIANSGLIVGTAYKPGVNSGPVLLTPVP